MPQDSPDLSDLIQRGYRFAYALTHHSAQAEDLVQDAWLAVIRSHGPHSAGYLFAAIRSRFIDACRKRGRIETECVDVDDVPDLRVGPAVVVDTDPSRMLDGFGPVEDDALCTALETLRPDDRAMLFLAVVDGCSITEISETYGVPRGTVMSRLYRTRNRLRQLLTTRSPRCQRTR